MTPVRISTILLLLGLLLTVKSLGQTYSSVTTDKEIYDFLNWMTQTDKKHGEEPRLRRKQIYYKILTWDTTNFISKDTALLNKYPFFDFDGQYLFQRRAGTDTIFRSADRIFLFQQFIAIKDTIWHEGFSNSKLIKNKNQKRPNRYYYSVPLFSLDKNYVIIRRQYYCGSLCAYGGFYIYKKINKGKWKYITSVNTWIS
jgi:hypothetical protein